MTKINILPASRHLPIVEIDTTSTAGSAKLSARAMLRFASLCLLLYWGAIFFATHLPSRALPKLHWSDKAYHAIAYAGLAFLLCWAIPHRTGKTLKHLVLAFSIGTIYGGLDELTQAFIPSRHCDIWDFAADLVGVAIGMSVYLTLRTGLLQLDLGRRLISRLSR